MGGVADYTAQLAEQLKARGCALQIITTAVPGVRASEEISPIPHWTPGSIRQITRVICGFRADIVHLQYQTAAFGLSWVANALPALLRAQGIRAPLITTFHDLRPPYLFPRAGRLRPLATHLLLGGSRMSIFTEPADLVRAHPRRPSFWIPIGAGVAADPQQVPSRSHARNRLGIDAETQVVAFFGFVNHSKGVEVLIRAAERLLHQARDIVVLFIGEGVGASDPTNRVTLREVEEEAARRGVARHMLHTGPLSSAEVSCALAAADCAALPFSDGASLRRSSLLTCLAHGVPVVTTIPTPTPTLAHGHLIEPFTEQSGVALGEERMVLVPRGDDAELARRVAELLDDPARRDQLGEAGRALAARLSWPRIAEATLAVYAHALQPA